MIWLILSLLIATVLEAYGWRMLLLSDEVNISVVGFLHLTASVCGASMSALYLPTLYNCERYLYRFGLFFTLLFLMPGFGLAGIALSVLPSLFYPKSSRKSLWREVPVPELPFKPLQINIDSGFGKGGLISVMRSARDPERRIRAVIAARQISDRVAVPLLKEALKDPVDDVRMFAYSVLDSKETCINNIITKLLAELEGAQEMDRAKIQYMLAQNYWELAFLELATDNSLDYVLMQAEKYIGLAAQSEWPKSDVEFLTGRIYMYQRKYELAGDAFRSSLECGALESTVLPFLSEVAFEMHDFSAVRSTLERLEGCCKGCTPIPLVVQSWRAS